MATVRNTVQIEAFMCVARQPVLAISHGGGPCFQIEMPPPFDSKVWAQLKAHLAHTGAGITSRPRAILVISGHWEEDLPTIGTASRHTLLYDYYGFPPEAYDLHYPAPGAPDVAERVRALLTEAGIGSRTDARRGLDHGVFVPLMVMFPDADIPIVPLSLRQDLDPAFHVALGRALAPLRDEGILIIGSGNTYHNLRALLGSPNDDRHSQHFDSWLNDTLTSASPALREQRLIAWAQAPSARECHPRAEHLLPFHVAAGAAASDVGVRDFHGSLLGKASSGYRFG